MTADAALRNRVTIRPYRPGDEHAILDTFNLVFRETNGEGYVDRTIDVWNWQFRDNPEGLRISLAVTDDGTVAAQYAGVPLRHATWRGEQTFVHIVDSFVHPQYRQGLKAPGLFVNTALPWFADCYRRGDALPYGFPVPRAERIGQRYLYYHRLRVVDYLCRDLSGDAPSEPPRGITVEPLRDLSDPTSAAELDELFARFARQRGCLTKRSAAYLRWRYQLAPGAPYQPWAARRGGTIVGLVVLRPQNELIGGACTIVDWVAPGPDATSVDAAVHDALLAAATAVGRAAGRRVLLAVFADPSLEHASLRQRGFVVTPSSHTMERRLTYQIFEHTLSEDFVREHWWYTLGDSDLA